MLYYGWKYFCCHLEFVFWKCDRWCLGSQMRGKTTEKCDTKTYRWRNLEVTKPLFFNNFAGIPNWKLGNAWKSYVKKRLTFNIFRLSLRMCDWRKIRFCYLKISSMISKATLQSSSRWLTMIYVEKFAKYWAHSHSNKGHFFKLWGKKDCQKNFINHFRRGEK